MRLAIAMMILLFSNMGPNATAWVFVLVFWKWLDD